MHLLKLEALTLVLQLDLLNLHALERLDVLLDLDGQALDVPRAHADEPGELAVHEPEHRLLDRARGLRLLVALVATAILSELAKEAGSDVAARGLDAREPFDWGSAFKAIAPIAKPFVAKIPKVGGFLSSFFKRDGMPLLTSRLALSLIRIEGSLDEELFADFLKASLSRRDQVDDGASSLLLG